MAECHCDYLFDDLYEFKYNKWIYQEDLIVCL